LALSSAGLEGLGIELEQELSGFYQTALFVSDLIQVALDPGIDLDLPGTGGFAGEFEGRRGIFRFDLDHA
jgi:hypothetical protein